MDQISDTKNREEHWIESISLNEAMNKLDQRERKILSMRFFEGKTQMEVAKEIHISQAQVSKLEKNALKTMKAYLSDREPGSGRTGFPKNQKDQIPSQRMISFLSRFIIFFSRREI